MTRKLLILGAAGRDYHNFNLLCRDDPDLQVVAFTAAQIPDIDGRRYPPELAGPLYPEGIPIESEERLEELLAEHGVDCVWFSYSDVSHGALMRTLSRALAHGCDAQLIAAQRTMLPSRLPVIAVTAVRTGVGKSQTSRFIAGLLQARGLRVACVRHPMPYGELSKQAVQRFESFADLDTHACTIEEREEYEPYIERGMVVFAGVDYAAILAAAEAEADVILWDGGNNDTPFYQPDLYITLLDPHRAGDELEYYPGHLNLLLADLLLINKVETATAAQVAELAETAARYNPAAPLLRCRSAIRFEQAQELRGKRVLVVEDGPTCTHGGMSRGAGWYAATRAGGQIIDPSPWARGSLQDTYRKYPSARGILPAVGYSPAQIADLQATIEATPCDVVVAGTPIDLSRVLRCSRPLLRVFYELEELEHGRLAAAVDAVLEAGKA